MSVITFTTRQTKARSRTRKDALSVIVPRLLQLKEGAKLYRPAHWKAEWPDTYQLHFAGLDISYAWVEQGLLNITVNDGIRIEGQAFKAGECVGQYPRVFAIYMDINRPPSAAQIATWKRGEWEARLFG